MREDLKVQIAGELCTVLKRLGVDAESLAIVGSGRDTSGIEGEDARCARVIAAPSLRRHRVFAHFAVDGHPAALQYRLMAGNSR